MSARVVFAPLSTSIGDWNTDGEEKSCRHGYNMRVLT